MGARIPAARSSRPSSTKETASALHSGSSARATGTAPCPYASALTTPKIATSRPIACRKRSRFRRTAPRSISATVGRMEVRMSTSAKGTKVPPAAAPATWRWLAKPCKVSPAHATASMIPREIVRSSQRPVAAWPLRGVFDQLLADQQGSATRREQPLPDQLRDRAGDRLAAGADLVGQLLLRRSIPDEEPFGTRRPILPADRDQSRYDTLLNSRQRQAGRQLFRALQARDQLGPEGQRQLGLRPQAREKRLAWNQQQRRCLDRLPVVGQERLGGQRPVGDEIPGPEHLHRNLSTVHRAADGPDLPANDQDCRLEASALRRDGGATIQGAQARITRERPQCFGGGALELGARLERLQARYLDRQGRPHQLTVGIEIECCGCDGHARLLGLRSGSLRNGSANASDLKSLRIFGIRPTRPGVTWRSRHTGREKPGPFESYPRTQPIRFRTGRVGSERVRLRLPSWPSASGRAGPRDAS